jgi:hypothetical protein
MCREVQVSADSPHFHFLHSCDRVYLSSDQRAYVSSTNSSDGSHVSNEIGLEAVGSDLRQGERLRAAIVA